MDSGVIVSGSTSWSRLPGLRLYASLAWYRSSSVRTPVGQLSPTGAMIAFLSRTCQNPMAWPTSCATSEPPILLLPHAHRSSHNSIWPSGTPTYDWPQKSELRSRRMFTTIHPGVRGRVAEPFSKVATDNVPEDQSETAFRTDSVTLSITSGSIALPF